MKISNQLTFKHLIKSEEDDDVIENSSGPCYTSGYAVWIEGKPATEGISILPHHTHTQFTVSTEYEFQFIHVKCTNMYITGTSKSMYIFFYLLKKKNITTVFPNSNGKNQVLFNSN